MQCLKLDQSSARGRGDRLCSAQHIQFGENAPQVPFHGEFADGELRANFLIAPALGEQLQNPSLTVGQGLAADAGYQFLHQKWGYAGFAAVHLADAIHQLLAPGIL